jgi:riboflavin biosynthesis pyrimidine reductase
LQPDETESLLALYHPLKGVRLNIAVHVSGAISGPQGSSDEISNPLDRRLLVELRRQSDVILTTGATARAEGIRRSKLAPIAIVTKTASAEFYSPELLHSDAQGKKIFFITLVVLSDELKKQLKAVAEDFEVIGLPDLEPATVLTHLTKLGFDKVLLETGPTVSRLWLSAGCIDEVCLSTTGIAQEPRTTLYRALPAWLDGLELENSSEFFSESHQTLFRRLSVAR